MRCLQSHNIFARFSHWLFHPTFVLWELHETRFEFVLSSGSNAITARCPKTNRLELRNYASLCLVICASWFMRFCSISISWWKTSWSCFLFVIVLMVFSPIKLNKYCAYCTATDLCNIKAIGVERRVKHFIGRRHSLSSCCCDGSRRCRINSITA